MNILIAGAGKIGSLLAQILMHRADSQVLLVDSSKEALEHIPQSAQLTTRVADIMNAGEFTTLLHEQATEAVISCLPYFCNEAIAKQCSAKGIHYFDLTEDVETVARVKQLAHGKQAAFVPRCGVAPGFINLLAYDLMQSFDSLDTVKLRAGCLPKYASNSLQYALMWSVDGLINEYSNPCEGILDGNTVLLRPLEDLETIELDGIVYEAFNTSGGVGELAQLYAGKVNQLNYKTMRYPGHQDRMRFLMQELHLNEDRETLKRILVRALPPTDADVMIVYVSVTGKIKGEFIEKNVVKRILPQKLFDQQWSAIQMATASSAATVIDMVLSNADHYHGLILQETLPFKQFMESPFAKVYQE